MKYFDELGKHISEMDDVVNQWIKRLGLNYNHFAVLYSLANAPNGQCTQKYICDEWLLPKQTVFNICKEYKANGWLEFSESQTDKREKIMYLTESGRAQATPIMHMTQNLYEHIFAQFGETKTAQLFALMHEFNTICRQQMDKTMIE